MHLSSPSSLTAKPTLPLVLLLTACYFVMGRLSLLLAIPPGFASSVWPAAGIALMALSLGGRRLWPGVFLGSFLVNLVTTWHDLGGWDLLEAAVVPAAIGSGAALQAVIGAWSIRRWLGFPGAMSRTSEILLLLTLGGPVSCLVSSTVGVTALIASGAILPTEAAFNWWTWWVGDSIGVLVIVPPVLAFMGGGDKGEKYRRWRVGIPISITTAAVVLVFVYARGQELRQLELDLNRRAQSLAHSVEKHIDRSVVDVMSVEGLFAGRREVSRQEFARFAQRILARNDALQALSWNPRVLDAERAAFEAAGRADGFVDYRFTEAAEDGVRTAGQRSHYVVVHFIEPFAGNEQALGFDIASDPGRREAVELARDTGAPAATPGIRLVQETGEQTGVLILMPTFADGVQPETFGERRAFLRGYATGVLRVGDALEAALAHLPEHGFEVLLLDLSGRSETVLAALNGASARSAEARWSWTFDRDVGGRTWSLRLAPTPDLLASYRRWYAWLVLAGGLGLVSLFGVLFLVQSGRANELAILNARLEEGLERRNRLERQQEGLIADLELRNAELERFSYTVSHDLKSPLITIKGYLGLLEKDLELERSEKVEAEIAQLHRSADRMRELIDDLLELSRAGQESGPLEALSLDELIGQVLDQLAGELIASGVTVDVAPALPGVRAHRAQVLAVLQNLIDNAIKFTRDCDGPRVEIGAALEGDRVVCYVRDNGIGIDPAHRERIFGLFNRLDHTRDGTGIGLALVRRIVELRGGSVWVESDGAGRGSTFWFTVPAADG